MALGMGLAWSRAAMAIVFIVRLQFGRITSRTDCPIVFIVRLQFGRIAACTQLAARLTSRADCPIVRLHYQVPIAPDINYCYYICYTFFFL